MAEKIVVLAVKVSRSRLKHANLHVFEALAPDCFCFLRHVKPDRRGWMDRQNDKRKMSGLTKRDRRRNR